MSGRFSITSTTVPGVRVVERKAIGDERGFLARLFCASELTAAGWLRPIAQINHTFTALRGTVRGMHFQRPPYAEMKLVTCVRGAIYDVAVDLREGSASLLAHHAQILSAENHQALLIPEGCAHGFQALTPDVEIIYLHSIPYVGEAEGGVAPLDPRLGINWPLSVAAMSTRDSSHPAIASDFKGLPL
jgi:dTDP-4-dehydrorhamnose 3,5-epimerase